MPFPSVQKLVSILACASLCGCGYGDSRTAHRAQYSMIGMSVNDLRACAGLPDKTQQLNVDTQIFQYGYKPSANGSFTVSPLNLSTLTFGGSGSYCTAIIRVVNDKVSEVHYTGDNDEFIGTDGVCSSLVRGCIRQPESTMTPVNGGLLSPVSAFHSPPIPPQSAQSVYNLPLKTPTATP
jgi:hypothetical protein